MVADLKNSCIFGLILTDQCVGSEMARNNRGFFVLSPLQYDGGLVFVPGNGRPCARICQAETATVPFWPLTKTCAK